MGTKGQKNTPITARVNAGLFNQKKGITEPLLNVGPAGVYGDNQTKDIPSPSKKRGYSMAKKKVDSPIKQAAEVGVNVLESSSTGDQIVEGKKIKRNKTFADLEAEGITVTPEMRQWSKDNPTAVRDQVETGETGPDTVVPGTTTETEEFTPTQTRDTNDAMSPWRVRQQSRSVKKSGKDVRQSQNKLDATNRKLKKLKDAGITSGRKFDRLKSKFTENTNELDAFNKNMTARTRQVEMSSDPLGKNGTFESSTRNMDLVDADTTYEGQKKIIKDGGVRKKRPIVKAVNELTPAGIVEPKTVLGKSTPSFFKTKSPMKKNYFK